MPVQLTIPTASVSLEAARALVRAAIAESERAGRRNAIAVVDAGGDLVAYERMDGTPKLTVEIAINKAWSAAAYGMGTHEWAAFVAADPGVAQIQHTPRLTTFGGGLPLFVEGRLVGGIGISGGHYSEDQAIGERALAELGISGAAG
jgi:uncharacterized protein GlcG (DUF336 family)